MRAALFAPSAASRQLQQEIVERATTCHDAHDLEYVITNDAVQSTTSESPEWTRRGHREVTRLAEAFNTHGRFANVRSHLEAARERCNPRLTEICAAIERATA